MQTSAGNSIIVDPSLYAWKTKAFTAPPRDQQIIYEMHIGTFAGLIPTQHPGTWALAIDKLDYLVQLGVNMIEVMAPAEFPGDWSWGYNTAYPFAPESAYGTPDDARRFIDEAHARGLGVIIDVVHNHYGPTDIAMWCFDGACPAGTGGSYFYPPVDDTPWGPRPDFGAPQVRAFIADNIRMWLDEYRADGIRWDATAAIRMKKSVANPNPDGASLLREISSEITTRYPNVLNVAEDLLYDPIPTAPSSMGGLGFGSQWDMRFLENIDYTLMEDTDATRDMNEVATGLAYLYNGRLGERVIYTESHDVAGNVSRVPEVIDPGHATSLHARKLSMLGAALVMTSPGIPMLFQGQEFLEDGKFSDQTALDWSKATTNALVLAYYKDLIRLRHDLDGHTHGLLGTGIKVFHVDDVAKVVAYHRPGAGGPGDDVVVVANFSATPLAGYVIGMPASGPWHVRLDGDSTAYGVDFGHTSPLPALVTTSGQADGFAQRTSVDVGPYSVIVLSR
jgi:1,4-alpha-glucan branching enzyme